MDNREFAQGFQARTKKFALDVIRFCAKLPDRPELWDVRRQLVRCATSVAANYRACCHARSKADFIAKMSVVEEEADETAFWLELLDDLKTRQNPELTRLHDEAGQLLAVVIASKKTARKNDAAGRRSASSLPT